MGEGLRLLSGIQPTYQGNRLHGRAKERHTKLPNSTFCIKGIYEFGSRQPYEDLSQGLNSLSDPVRYRP